MNVSPLRYPGGKTRACKVLDKLFIEYFEPNKITTIISPFFGGGSFEFYLQNKYNYNIICNDKFEPLYNFWNICKNNKEELCNELDNINEVTKEIFTDYRNKIFDEKNAILKAMYYFVINRCSFSGSTCSGGFSYESSKKRFTKSSIERIKKLNLDKFEIYNYDFEEFINIGYNDNYLLFFDPPYYLEKTSKLYGNKGDLHQNFDHLKLFNLLKTKSNWILTYNNCEFIKDLYSEYTIIETNWSYGMNKTKKSSEIVIINNF